MSNDAKSPCRFFEAVGKSIFAVSETGGSKNLFWHFLGPKLVNNSATTGPNLKISLPTDRARAGKFIGTTRNFISFITKELLAKNRIL